MRGDASDDYRIDRSAITPVLVTSWQNLRLLQIVVEVVVDRLGVAMLHTQNELDLVKGAAVSVQQRLHQDRHDAFSNTRPRADVSQKGCHKTMCQMDDIQDVAMGDGLPLRGLSFHRPGKQVFVKGS